MLSPVPSSNWQAVMDLARANEIAWAREPTEGEWGIHHNDDPPHNRLLGPVFPRGPASGVIVLAGEEQCAWGEPDRADMTFSVTKTYLALVAGVAFDRGLIDDVNEAVSVTLKRHGIDTAIGFEGEHNEAITWFQMLQFTSEWQGECFGVPDQIDRYRIAGSQPTPAVAQRKGDARPLQTPGTYWEYNDVRINQFSLALMHLFKQPLPDILDQAIMQALGCSNSWRWHGYDNSWTTIDGKKVQSVPGGGHWGGGMQISARDQALVGQLMLSDGRWQGKTLVSKDWITKMRTPCALADFYGFFTWLNTGRKTAPAASDSSYFAFGIGGQMLWHDPERDLIAVFRWTTPETLNDLVQAVDRAIQA